MPYWIVPALVEILRIGLFIAAGAILTIGMLSVR
jgi:hypothetical protein